MWSGNSTVSAVAVDTQGNPGHPEAIATPGNILAEDEDAAFERDSTTDDMRVHTVVSWLEEEQLLTREENLV